MISAYENDFQQHNCTLSGHEEERVQAVCLKSDCTFASRLLCLDCLMSEHSQHATFCIKLKELKRDREELKKMWPQETALTKKFKNLQHLRDSENSGKKTGNEDCVANSVTLQTMPENIVELFESFNNSVNKILEQTTKEVKKAVYSEEGARQEAFKRAEDVYFEHVNFMQVHAHLRAFAVNEMSAAELQQKLQETFSAIAESEADYRKQLCNLKQIAKRKKHNTTLIAQKQDEILKKLQALPQLVINAPEDLLFMPSAAYRSEESILLQNENKTAIFRNRDRQAVVYTPVLPLVPVTIKFIVLSTITQHLCLGLRKDSERDEETYNRQPYFCLHCNAGSGINLTQRFCNKGQEFAVRFAAESGFDVMQARDNQVIASHRQDFSKDSMRLYAWSNNHQSDFVIGILSTHYD